MTTSLREITSRRNLLAFRAAIALGWPRERIVAELGISRRTYFRWLEQIRRHPPEGTPDGSDPE